MASLPQSLLHMVLLQQKPCSLSAPNARQLSCFHLTFEQCVICVTVTCPCTFWSIFKLCCPFNAELYVRHAEANPDIPRTPAAKSARLRRVCELKPSGKIKCPEWLHEQWKNTANRPQLTTQLESANWDKARIISKTMTRLMTCDNTQLVFKVMITGHLCEANGVAARTQEPEETWDGKGMVQREWHEGGTGMETDTWQQGKKYEKICCGNSII